MKLNRIIYWATTGLISAGFLMSSVMYFSQNPELVENFRKIGIPLYFIFLLGTAKFLGAIAVVNPWFPKLREWAYAGYTFTLIGAVWVHIATSTPFVAPLIFLLLTGVSYYFQSKVYSPKLAFA